MQAPTNSGVDAVDEAGDDLLNGFTPKNLDGTNANWKPAIAPQGQS
jgi:hypothetical protein